MGKGAEAHAFALGKLQAASCGLSVRFEGHVCVFPFSPPVICSYSPKVGCVGPILSQSICSRVCEQLTFKRCLADSPAQMQSHLGGCILSPKFLESRAYCLPQVHCVFMFRCCLNPQPLEQGLQQHQGDADTWREASLSSQVPSADSPGDSFLASLFFHLSLRNDNACHFCVSQTCCYQEHCYQKHSLIYRDERCWINSKLYLLFFAIITS